MEYATSPPGISFIPVFWVGAFVGNFQGKAISIRVLVPSIGVAEFKNADTGGGL